MVDVAYRMATPAPAAHGAPRAHPSWSPCAPSKACCCYLYLSLCFPALDATPPCCNHQLFQRANQIGTPCRYDNNGGCVEAPLVKHLDEAPALLAACNRSAACLSGDTTT